jgi:putative ABC transport system ATP-binding protein
MKVYVAGLIDKSLHLENAKLKKKLVLECKRALRVSGKAMYSQELNSFIVLSAEKSVAPSQKMIQEIEAGSPYKNFKKYCIDNEAKLQQELKTNQELNETSKIVKDFIREVHPNLVKNFNEQLKKIVKQLPVSYREIQQKSYVALWDIAENQQYRFFLSGFNSAVFTGSSSNGNLEELVDKLLMANFFEVFLEPTITRLKELDGVLERLQLGVEGTHYKTTDPKLQKKLELFFRILTAKLSALQDIDNLLSRIFKLFIVPHDILKPYKIENTSLKLNKALADMASKIEMGEKLLHDVSEKLQNCQVHLRDYLDENKNGVRTIQSMDEFKNALLPIAELSIDLFVEAELLKMWSDFFGLDIPYFRFSQQLFNTNDVEVNDVAKDCIIAVRGLVKNYILGSTTVYALRGVNLDVKEGEFVAIVGNSGAGKTTLLNCMAGLDSPDYGVVLFRGQNLHKMDDKSKSKARLLEMGFIFQSYALLPHFSAKENIALPADLAGLSKDLKERVDNLLKDVGLSNQAKQFPATLSGGQMQRVAIARALTNRPAVIFADEPTGDLDSATGKQVMDLLKKFHEETKTTIIVITHAKDVADYAVRQITIEDGIIVQSN